jgi:hypothetical protein
MCTKRSKEERDRCAPAGLRGDGQLCTCRLRIRGMDVRTSRPKEERDRYAPAG